MSLKFIKLLGQFSTAFILSLSGYLYAQEPVTAGESDNATPGGIVKWTDEKGHVHYGDKVPDQYKNTAKTIEEDKVQFVEQKPSSSRPKAGYKYPQSSGGPVTKKINRMDKKSEEENMSEYEKGRIHCRNSYPNNVKYRTQCFNSIGTSDES